MVKEAKDRVVNTDRKIEEQDYKREPHERIREVSDELALFVRRHGRTGRPFLKRSHQAA